MNDFNVGIGVGTLIWLGVILWYDPADTHYEKGQIDCINGNIYYKLIEQEDKTKIWEEIDPRADPSEIEP